MNMFVKPLTFLLGLVFVVFGIAGFFSGSPLIVFQVDPLQNVIHLVSGLIALYCAHAGDGMSRAYLMLFGLVYALIAVIGFIQGHTVLGLIGVNLEDNLLHAAIAALSLLVGFGSKKV